MERCLAAVAKTPVVWATTALFLPPNAFVIHRLTGDIVVDHSSAGNIGGIYDMAARLVAGDHGGSRHSRPQRRAPRAIDKAMYQWRYLIENVFCKLKAFKRIALRGDKSDTSFAAMIYLGAAIINSPCFSTSPRH